MGLWRGEPESWTIERSMATPAPTLSQEQARSDARQHDAATVIRHIAHELRQPLSTIDSIAYYLDMILPRSEPRARVQVGKLQQLVQQASWILADSVYYLQASPPRPELLDLNEIVSEVLAESPAADRPTVNLILDDQLPLVRLDLEQARHLVRNLLFFVSQVAREASGIQICTWSEDRAVRLEFTCAANDLHVDDPEILFEPFVPHPPAGSGLALASVRRIAEAHGGSVWIKAEFQGSVTIGLTFPSAD